MPSFLIVFCRKSTLLCRQLVRRSMVFSTVQISMPGTSCAWAFADRQGVSSAETTKTVRPIIKSSFKKAFITANCSKPPGDTRDTTLIPHSGAVVSLIAGMNFWPRHSNRRLQAPVMENDHMATREKRMAQFDGNGEPPPDPPAEVLCEDHSGTYQLPI